MPFIYLHPLTIADVPLLHAIRTSIYAHYFGEYWEEGALEPFLEKEYSTARLLADLEEPFVHWFLIRAGENTAGFAKMLSHSNLPGLPKEEGCELVKIYLAPEHKGCGIGKKAMLELITFAKSLPGKKALFLDVLDTNLSVIAFYEKLGFLFTRSFSLSLPGFKAELNGINEMELRLD